MCLTHFAPYKLNHPSDSYIAFWQLLLWFQDCCLVVYHPYRPLVQYVSDISNTDDGILPLAW